MAHRPSILLTDAGELKEGLNLTKEAVCCLNFRHVDVSLPNCRKDSGKLRHTNILSLPISLETLLL